VMGGYLLMFPRARIDILIIFIIFFRIIPIPAWIMLGLWFAMQLFAGFSSPGDGGGVAYWAHAGGFIAGVTLMVPVWLSLGGIAFWRRTEGEPPHPVATYTTVRSSIPRVRRK
jgi:membrane associated rhomboid family serine protease